MEIKYRIGIATSDGIVVNQHFGRAEHFLILDIDNENQIHVVENRKLPAICMGGNHDDNALEKNAESLSDCNYLLVSRIGQGALSVLEQKGISVYELPGMIEESVQKLSAYLEIQSMLS